ncbi:prepilin peptidase-dependent protein [Erwinia sorbitola]|uniref:Prepilin peptidase-dependent protein n=1 Tax=Erwinia sorbitola TaxID=2681984 RepID=A0ABW9RDR4_9GAMM|nr:prepilin peptidase-dependent protein [Erwinia sorbitola]MTD28324.1 prepilin peptidase-dependent protein [Erwinia sorbitola]
MSVKAQGFTLLEMLIALAIGSLLLVGAVRTLPQLQGQNLRLIMQAQLHEDLQQIMHTLEKAVRRAGYCHGSCRDSTQRGMHIGAGCLLVRWDENSNGRWEAAGRDNSEVYGYRLRDNSLEMQRGVSDCRGSGWEKLNDPRRIGIRAFKVENSGRQVKLYLSGYLLRWPDIALDLEQWLTAENL